MVIIRETPARRPSIIFHQDILDYGWESAYILANIFQCVNGDGSIPNKDELWEFPCFKYLFTRQQLTNKIKTLTELNILEEVENA